MKQLLLTSSLLVLSVAFTSCNKEDSKTTTQLESKDAKSVDEIIRFNNEFMKEAEGRDRFFSGLSSYLEAAEKKVKGENVLVTIKPIFVSASRGNVDEAPDVFGKVKTELDKNLKIASEKFKSIRASVDDLEKYLSAEDFKDDSGKKFTEINAQIKKDQQEYYNAYDAALKTMSPVTMAAEEEILKDHPLKKQIISSKTNLNNADLIVKELSVQSENNQYNEQKLLPLYNQLEKSYQENLSLKIDESDASLRGRKSSYDSYNRSLEGFLGAVRKFMRDSKEKNAIDDDSFNGIESPYKSLVSSYNNFVD